MGNKVFVTGATGLLGSHLICYLLQTGHSVCALKRAGSDLAGAFQVFGFYPGGQELWKEVRWVEGDVLKPETYVGYIRQAEVVYHCAAMVSFDEGDRVLLEETNLRGTENIAAACLECGCRLCYVSSIAALGDAVREMEVIDEATPVIEGREHSVYSWSKGNAEKIAWEFVGRGLDAVIVCPSVILGPGVWTRSSSRLFAAAARGIPVYPRGVTGYVDVRDVVALMVRLAEDGMVRGERFVLNGGNYSFRELFTMIARAYGKRPPCFYLRPWMGEVAWRFLAVVGRLAGRRPAFTRETARTSQHRSFYSNAKISNRYPDFCFHTLEETVGYIKNIREGLDRFSN